MAKKTVQKNLFGEIERMFLGKKEEPLPPLCIAKPKKKDYDGWVKELSYHLTLDKLRLMAAPFVDILRKHKVYYNERGGTAAVPPAVAKMLETGNKPKATLAEFVALFLEPSNFMLYFNNLSSGMQKLWRTTFLKGTVTAKEANKLAGEKVISKVTRWYEAERSMSQSLLGWFDASARRIGTSYSYEGVLSLNKKVTDHLIPTIFADVMEKGKELENLPEDSHLLTFCGEDDIFTQLPTIIALRESKTLEQKQNGCMSMTSLKAAVKRMAMPEFFPGNKDANTAILRSQMVLHTIGNAVSIDRRKKKAQEEELINSALRSAINMEAFILAVVCPELSGLRATLFYDSEVTDVVNAFFYTVCDTDNKNWRSFDALLLETMVESSDLDFQLFSSYDYERVKVVNKYSAKDVDYTQIREQITLPLLRGFAFLLAALGLVEIAYQEPQFGNASPYDGLQYVRVTELGRYCAGRVKDYTPKSITNKQFFEADDDQLIIKSLEDNNPLKPIITTMADPITQRLYKVNYTSFLRDCTTSDDIDNRIAQFKRYVCPTPTQVWTKFFADVRRRFKPFTTVSTKYSLAQIPADNKELQRILLTDPVIRKYTVKAEGYLLLIEIAHQKQVAERLKTYGYLI